MNGTMPSGTTVVNVPDAVGKPPDEVPATTKTVPLEVNVVVKGTTPDETGPPTLTTGVPFEVNVDDVALTSPDGTVTEADTTGDVPAMI